MINIFQHLDVWTSAVETRSTAGRGSSNKLHLYGIKKLRELILELAVRGQLVAQDPNDEPASVLLEKIAAEKARLVKEGKIKKQEPMVPIGEDEKPFGLPVGWEWVRLGDVITLISGQHLDPNDYIEDNSSGYIPYISGPADFGSINPDPVRFTKEKRAIANANDILLTVKGSGVGKLNIANQPELAIGRQIMAVRSINIFNDYLYIWMMDHAKYFQLNKTGIAIPGIGRDDVLDAIFCLPPLAEQHRIVAKVSELMLLCDALEQEQASSIAAHQTLVEELLAELTTSTPKYPPSPTLPPQGVKGAMPAWARIATHFDTLFTTEHSIDQLKQTILQLAVMGKLVPQDPNDEPASVLLQKIAAEKARLINEGKIKKEKPLPAIGEGEKAFELPEGWEWVRLHDVLALVATSLSRDIFRGKTTAMSPLMAVDMG